MPQPVARMTDIGIGVCFGHALPIPIVGTIVIGSPNTLANGLSQARLGDLVMCSCGHPATLILGSPTVLANGLPKSRMVDMFTGSPIGFIIIGSPNVIIS